MIDFSTSMPAKTLDEIETALHVLSESGFYFASVNEFLCNALISASGSDIEVFKNELAGRCMNIDWVHAPFRGIVIYSDQDKDLYDHSMGVCRKAIRIAASLGAQSVIVHPFPSHCSPDMDFASYLPVLRESYGQLIDFAAEVGTKVAIENLMEKPVIPVTRALLDELAGLYLCLDTGHANISGFWDAGPGSYGKKLVALHCNDNGGNADDHLWPGRGTLDTMRILKAVFESGYRGIWGLECRVASDGTDDAIVHHSALLDEFSSMVFAAKRAAGSYICAQ
ncbi:MAG: sugar phosphate isomerase/epimerase [Spirochaetales bacterium]|nr:sugar phosphate isomerase/epimerase [Spirochaetales bacterium]